MFIFQGKLKFKADRISLFFPVHTLSVTEFDDFLVNFEKLVNYVKQLKSAFLLILVDFNAQFKSWQCEDITSHKGPQIKSLTMSYGVTAVNI